MSQVEIVQVNIDHKKVTNFIQQEINDAVLAIVKKCKQDYNMRYSDNMYLQLYNMCQVFSKQVTDLVTTENTNPDDSLFGTIPNLNSQQPRRQF